MTRPSARQLAFLEWEFGAFFHFGIRSFFMGHRDWDDRPMPASEFNPDRLDCEQWISTVRAAGAKYAILVCKHHDGFANWPSRYSDYGVAQSPWRDGRGDVVREFVNACRKYDMKVGFYYSPAQWGGAVSFSDDTAYDDYFVHQIEELLSNYGRIDYLWFDACGSDGHEYDRTRIISTIRALQPEILIFEMWDPDTRWVGNEDGYADLSNSCVRDGRFLPAECDCMLRDTWFDCEPNEDKIKQTDELMGMYEMSVGRGANFLLNIGPNCHGLLNDADVKRVTEFGQALRRRYGQPVAAFGGMTAAGENAWAIQTGGEAALVNRVVLMEDLTDGETVREFEVWASLPRYADQQICLYRGRTIGHKAICAFPTMRTGRLSVKITAADGACRLRDFKAYCAE